MKALWRIIFASTACAGALFGLFGWLRVIPSNSSPFGAGRISQAPRWAANDPQVSVYLGQGCFWHTQFDFVHIERDSSGPFSRTTHGEVTSLVGYAGGLYEGRNGAVCYHGDPDLDYSRLGHAEAVSVQLELQAGSGSNNTRAASQFARLVTHYFDQGFQPESNLRLDPQDAGAQYRNIIGLPNGLDNEVLGPVLRAAAERRRMPLVPGEGGPAHDQQGEHVVYVYDSQRFPFFRAEAYHQFHRNAVLRRPVPSWYTGALKQQQAEAGRLGDTGCAGAAAAMGYTALAFVFAIVALVSLPVLAHAVQELRTSRRQAAQSSAKQSDGQALGPTPNAIELVPPHGSHDTVVL